jgi:diguanylate cyclase (GGDEF)-like protein
VRPRPRMPRSAPRPYPNASRGVQRLYFRIVQGTVLTVLAFEFFMRVAYGMPAAIGGVPLVLYGTVLTASGIGVLGSDEDLAPKKRPKGLLFAFIALLLVLLCAETGGPASPYILLLFTTCVFGALVLKPNAAVTVTALASLTYLASIWLSPTNGAGLLSAGIPGIEAALRRVPRLRPETVSTLVAHCSYFWLGTIIAMRVAESMRRRVDHAESAAVTDPLTGLPNRRGFKDKLRLESERISRWDWSIAMLVIDLDHFKRVNDDFDHEVGDLVLVHAGRVLREGAGPLDHVARLGGEEFAIASVGSDRQHAEDLARRIIHAFRRNAWSAIAPGLGPLTCSIGISVRTPSRTPEGVIDFDAMIQEADHALMIRKKNGRNGLFVAGDTVPLPDPAKARVVPRRDPEDPVPKARFIRRRTGRHA